MCVKRFFSIYTSTFLMKLWKKFWQTKFQEHNIYRNFLRAASANLDRTWNRNWTENGNSETFWGLSRRHTKMSIWRHFLAKKLNNNLSWKKKNNTFSIQKKCFFFSTSTVGFLKTFRILIFFSSKNGPKVEYSNWKCT